MPVLFNFVRKKEEGEEGEERKIGREKEGEREKFQVLWLYYENQLLGKRRNEIFGVVDIWKTLLFKFHFIQLWRKGRKRVGSEKGQSDGNFYHARFFFFFIPKMLEPENKFRGNYKITLVVYAVFVWQSYGCPSFVLFHTAFNCVSRFSSFIARIFL